MSWDETLKLTQADESEEFKLFEAVVNGDVTVEDAVQWVITTTMDRLEDYGPGGSIEKADAVTFIAIIELAMQIDTTQYGPLVEFLGELKLYNAVDSSTGLILKTQDGSRVWSHLPSLNFWVAEIWTDRMTQICDPDMEPDQQIRWAKLNIFLAQVTQAAEVEYTSLQVSISDAMDVSHMALCGLRHVFEERIPSEHIASTAGLLGVCYWLICAGDRLWENVLNGRKYNRYDGRPGELYSDRGWKGFERERWDIWVQGLRDAKAACRPGKELVEDLIDRALSKIERVMSNEIPSN
ncbi:hypothetical protein DTO006G1_2139 [Penicillium roqueforti]|uniref:uncharacterized protein n=1 Tax=Penicillium roqueforti TaxID=5082 RepID=UPI00190D3368|nr:uncharacterized protein LCP9604111_428 [Penicillium roqueforti]KAF9252902.1 hypothetical protein LCP9604111_428 [Penicillium roqueforti]KAI2724085.1 hypothetical protein CBS147318_1016 [Penicillium roqueforti]KAI2763000.1 hypothetical protein DTO006G1_2139 [Penicillium roqueforti]KAI3113103.1 hypothetical protein CBS147333_3095 [Penicillium roqueforti]KAI3132861.1 hypothetical protein CBS147330_4045 [Penicillium roqueforti]